MPAIGAEQTLGGSGRKARFDPLGESSRACAQSLFSSQQFAAHLADRFRQLLKQ
jgi:hypothetical protein